MPEKSRNDCQVITRGSLDRCWPPAGSRDGQMGRLTRKPQASATSLGHQLTCVLIAGVHVVPKLGTLVMTWWVTWADMHGLICSSD